VANKLPSLLDVTLAFGLGEIMLRTSKPSLYLLAHNAKAKARPNFGLPGVGYWTSTTYHAAHHNFWVWICTVFPCAAFMVYGNSGIIISIDDWCGGGARHITPKQMGVNLHADKPWNFRFGVGEGFKAGEAKYKKAAGAADLAH
jgi:hypothetical protein